MTEPIFDETTEAVYYRLPEHYRRVDVDYQLKKFLAGICSIQNEITTLIKRFEYISPDEGGVTGDTSDLVDPATADEAWLPWLAQLLGANINTRVIDNTTRNEIINASNGYLAGTDKAIISAVQSELVGTKTVRLKKRTTSSGAGGAWDLLIQTLSSETLQNILPTSVVIPSSTRSWIVISDPVGDEERILLSIAKDSAFYKSRALEFRAVPTNSGIGSEPGDDDDGFGQDDFGLEEFGTGDEASTAANIFTLVNPTYFPLDGSDPLTTMVDISYLAGTNSTLTITAGIELFDYDGVNYVSQGTVEVTDQIINVGTAARFLGRSESIDIDTTHGRFFVKLENVGAHATVHIGHFGARKENNNIWVPRSADPIKAVLDRGAKPAGLKLWHTYLTSSWDNLENGGATTWADLEALPGWTEVEEFDG